MTAAVPAPAGPWPLFAVYGVEIEYMIADRRTLDIRPWADRLLRDASGIVDEVPRGAVTWCNELAAHLIEIKCEPPVADLAMLLPKFVAEIGEINRRLAADGAQLIPSSMHPWMDPKREIKLWPGGFGEVYAAYDRIFSCRGHGWVNLQSVQLNLPFDGDREFGRLHAALRLMLPLLNALAASSPYAGGRATGYRSYRMEVYRHNADRVPEVAGDVVPEPVFSIAAYQRRILEPMYRAIAPLDPAGVLAEEWLNSRGALPRFSRQSIEVRTLDSQECVTADFAVLAAVTALARALVEERWCGLAAQEVVDQALLVELFKRLLIGAETTPLAAEPWRRLLGLPQAPVTAGHLWAMVLDRLDAEGLLPTFAQAPLDRILSTGTLATRLLAAAGDNPGREKLRRVYAALADCLAADRMFEPCAVS